MLRDIIKRKGNANKIFTAGGRIDTIKPIDNLDHLVFEQELSNEIDIEKFRQKLKNYQSLESINDVD